MNILITGGAGFIGSQIGWHLRQAGHFVTVLDNMSYGKDDNLKVNGEWVEDVEANFMKGDVIMRMGNGACFNGGEYPEWYEKEHTEYEDGPMTMYEVSLEF